MDVYDVGIVGCGAMGSSAAFHLSATKSVIVWERWSIPHSHGSSHGHSRIIRMSYAEDPGYVVLAQRSYKLWAELEALSGVKLLYKTGGLDIGQEDSEIFQGAKTSCEMHNLEHEILSADQVNQRFPGFQLPAKYLAVYQKDAGFLDPEACISACVSQAIARGAEVRGCEAVLGFEQMEKNGEKVYRVTSTKGTYMCRKLLLCAGAWTNSLLATLDVPILAERQVLGWFSPRKGQEGLFQKERFPIFILDDEGERFYYGFPEYKIPGVKVGLFGHFHELVDIEKGKRAEPPSSEDEAALRHCFDMFCPDVSGPVTTMETCMFCNSPDHHFILDQIGTSGLFLAAGFSGHGFKFASAIGEILANRMLGLPMTQTHELFAENKFSLSRFSTKALEIPKVYLKQKEKGMVSTSDVKRKFTQEKPSKL